MRDFAWEARPLLIFTPSLDDNRLTTQMRHLEDDAEALRDRDMRVIVTGPESVEIDGQASDLSAPAMRDRYGVAADDFAVLLIGKDTGVKLRSDDPVSMNDIYALIDSMPMRRREMREGG